MQPYSRRRGHWAIGVQIRSVGDRLRFETGQGRYLPQTDTDKKRINQKAIRRHAHVEPMSLRPEYLPQMDTDEKRINQKAIRSHAHVEPMSLEIVSDSRADSVYPCSAALISDSS